MRLQRTLLFGALNVALTFCVASALRPAYSAASEMVRYLQTSRVQQPDGSTSVVDVSAVTASAERKRTDDRFGTYVIECDRKRTISWSSRDKGYVVKSLLY